MRRNAAGIPGAVPHCQSALYAVYQCGTGTTMGPTSLSWLQMLAIALSLLFVPAVCGVAYRLGYQQFSFAEFMTFAKRADKPPKDTEI